MLKLFLYLHLVGLALLIVGVFFLISKDGQGGSVASIVGIASAIGLGLLLMSPFPVVKAIQWMKGQND